MNRLTWMLSAGLLIAACCEGDRESTGADWGNGIPLGVSFEAFAKLCPIDNVELSPVLIDPEGMTDDERRRRVFFTVDTTDVDAYVLNFNDQKELIEVWHRRQLYSLTEEELKRIRVRGF